MPQTSPAKTVVLIVEDEALIRMGVADYVEDAGLTPVEAANADEALTILDTCPNIDVVVTDVNMPGRIDGLDLSRIIAEKWPRIGVIVTSGRALLGRSELTAGAVFHPKPYELSAVLRSIHDLAAA